MPDNVEGISHPFGMRPIDRERRPAGGRRDFPQGKGEREDAPPTEEEVAQAVKKLQLEVDEINRRMGELGHDITLKILPTPNGSEVHIISRERAYSLGEKGWEITRTIPPDQILKWLARLDEGEGLIIDEDA